MKEYYMVGLIKKEMKVKVLNLEIPLEMSWADGMIGTIPVFKDIDSAIKYKGNADVQIMSFDAEPIKSAMEDLALKILQEETDSFTEQTRLRDDVIDAMIRFANECKQCNIQRVVGRSEQVPCLNCGTDSWKFIDSLNKYRCDNCGRLKAR